jgi:hypothetical protein
MAILRIVAPNLAEIGPAGVKCPQYVARIPETARAVKRYRHGVETRELVL